MKSNLVIITGASKGLGLAISNLFLDPEYSSDNENAVINISRSNSTINSSNLKNFNIDLTNIVTLEQPLLDHFGPYFDKDWDKIILINNAATIHPVSGITGISTEELTQSININYIAPIVLIKHFVKNFSRYNDFTIVNISSGAANSNIDGWSIYSSSKAALNRFTENMDSEFSSNKKIRFMIFNPGIMDTSMQRDIRNSEFKDREKFVLFKENGDLRSPDVVARHLVGLIQKDNFDLYESIQN